MPAPEFKEINADTIEAVAALLAQRNQTLPAYVRWKYLSWRSNDRRGVVAYLNDEAAGCFGLIPRTLRDAQGREFAAAWFADWFVAPTFRQSGLGRALLAQLAQQYKLIIGHPGTAPAQKLCADLGYRTIPFQARRRMIFQPLAYERRRTNFFAKALARYATYRTQSWLAQRSAKHSECEHDHYAAFTETESFSRWMFQQPVRASMQRDYAQWEADKMRVFYCDDTFLTGEKRRRVLCSEGAEQTRVSGWRAFFADCRAKGCTYAELFTTHPAMDNAWAQLGALPYPDQAVVHLGNWPEKLWLHGWDRENWTFLADHATNE